jgi:DNA-binding phage protein
MLAKHFTPQPDAPVFLTVEEEAILADDMAQATTDMETVGNELDRTTDTTAVNADAAEVVGDMPEVGNVEQDLIASVAEMAVAGTDGEAADVAVNTEPTDGLATESIAETIKTAVLKVWETIKQGLNKLWDMFDAFFKNVTAYLTGIKSKVDKIHSLLGNREQELVKHKIEDRDVFKGNTAALLINGKQSDRLAQDFTDFRSVSQLRLDAMANYGVGLMEEGADLFEEIAKNPTKVEQNHDIVYLNKFHTTLGNMAKSMQLKTNEATGELEPDTSKYLGGFGVVGKFPLFNNSKDLDGALAKLGTFSLELSKVQPSKVELKLTNSVQTIRTITAQAEEWLKVVQKNSARISDVASKAKAAREHLDKVAKQGSEEKDEADKGKIQKYMTQILSINGRINKVVAGMLASTVGRGNMTTNAALDYCIQSLNLVAAQKAPEKA